jgi:hypothetical protein
MRQPPHLSNNHILLAPHWKPPEQQDFSTYIVSAALTTPHVVHFLLVLIQLKSEEYAALSQMTLQQ